MLQLIGLPILSKKKFQMLSDLCLKNSNSTFIEWDSFRRNALSLNFQFSDAN
jgi:hypothetical protein